ncbi:CpaD family pilus assembly protein [Sphingomonas sp. RS6]
MYSRFLPLLAAPALLLGGCSGYNGGLESVHQPVVERHDYVLDLQTDGDRLGAGETQRLTDWLAAMNLRYGDHIAVDDGAGGIAGRSEVAALAGNYGLMIDDRAPVTASPVAPGTVRVVVTRMTASVPGCPDYSHPGELTADASTSSNFGCATNANLAAMVADPRDLVRGAPAAPVTDPLTSTKAIRALRAAAPSGGGGTTIKSESATGGGSK